MGSKIEMRKSGSIRSGEVMKSEITPFGMCERDPTLSHFIVMILTYLQILQLLFFWWKFMYLKRVTTTWM